MSARDWLPKLPSADDPAFYREQPEPDSPLSPQDLWLILLGGLILAASRLVIAPVPIAAGTALASAALAYRLSRRCYVLLTLTGALFGIGIGASFHAYLVVGTHKVNIALVRHIAEIALSGALIGIAACLPLLISSFRRPDNRLPVTHAGDSTATRRSE